MSAAAPLPATSFTAFAASSSRIWLLSASAWIALWTAFETWIVRVAAFEVLSTEQPLSSVTSALPLLLASIAMPVSVTWS